MSALTKAEQTAVHSAVNATNAKLRASEIREKELLTLLTQQNELLLGILLRVSDNVDPDPDFSDWVFRTNEEIDRAEVARDAGMRVADLENETPTEI